MSSKTLRMQSERWEEMLYSGLLEVELTWGYDWICVRNLENEAMNHGGLGGVRNVASLYADSRSASHKRNIFMMRTVEVDLQTNPIPTPNPLSNRITAVFLTSRLGSPCRRKAYSYEQMCPKSTKKTCEPPPTFRR